jgi:DNA-binding transcriptional MerR regulator
MATITFDTLKFVEHLREAGVPEAQAKAMSDAQKELLTEIFEQKELATKTDIKDIELKIAETKAELVRWVVGAGFLQTALIAALLMKLIK